MGVEVEDGAVLRCAVSSSLLIVLLSSRLIPHLRPQLVLADVEGREGWGE